MRLDALVENVGQGDAAARVTGFAIDHRKVAPGTVFGAFQGARVNGEDFIDEAIAAGAVAVVARATGEKASPQPTMPVSVSMRTSTVSRCLG